MCEANSKENRMLERSWVSKVLTSKKSIVLFYSSFLIFRAGQLPTPISIIQISIQETKTV